MKKCSPKGAIRPLIHVNKEVSCKSFRTERTRSSPDATASWRIEGAEESRQRGGWKKLRSERYWGSGPLDIIHSGKDSTLHWGREEVLSDFSSGGEVSSLNRLGSASLHCSEQTSWGHELTQKNCLRTEHSNPGRRQWRFGPEAHHGVRGVARCWLYSPVQMPGLAGLMGFRIYIIPGGFFFFFNQSYHR